MSRKVTFKGQSPNSDAIDHATDCINAPDSSTAPYRFDINLFELARVIFDKRRLVIGITCVVTVLTATYLLLQPNLYTSTATILPSGKTSNFSALTSLVGLGSSLGAPDENSSMLYPVVLRSNLIVDAVLDQEYTFVDQAETRTVSLADYFGIENRDRLRTALRTATSVNSDYQTGEISIGVETQYPALSQAITGNYLLQLEDFNRNKRRSSARDNEKYLARQLAAVKQELQASEDALESFRQTNLDWAISGSPEILKEHGRLLREVDARTATYTLLTQEHEMAKLEAQKDIPVIRILDAPSLPTVKSGPFRRNLIIFSGVITFIIVTFILIVRHLAMQAINGDGRDEYEHLRHEVETAFPRTRTAINRIKTVVREKTPLIRQ